MTPLQYIGVDPDALHFCSYRRVFQLEPVLESELTHLITRGQQESDPDKREGIYREVQKIIMDQAVMMPIRQNIDLHDIQNLTGLTYSEAVLNTLAPRSHSD